MCERDPSRISGNFNDVICVGDAKNRLLSREGGKVAANTATIRVQLAPQQTVQLNI